MCYMVMYAEFDNAVAKSLLWYHSLEEESVK